MFRVLTLSSLPKIPIILFQKVSPYPGFEGGYKFWEADWDGDGEHGEPSGLEADGDSWDGDGDGELSGF